ncbi:MAG TPA: DUF222 domain-containing protein, partial [Microbacterium sp.]|uniref:HNH endonuclease signature motif containing protein n=1 Tax=Microbacterium sp. TaxID=51671 RepID=UPI002CA11967
MHSNEPDRSGDAPASLVEAEAAILDTLVTTIVEARAGIAAFQAFETRALAAAAALGAEQMGRVESLASRDREMPLRSIAAELAAAVRTSDRSVQRQLDEATLLVEAYPATLTAWGEGKISRAHVSVIVQAGFGIENPDARAGYETEVLRRAFVETPGRLGPIAKLLAHRAQPRTLEDRHAEAREERRVRVTDLPDGMAELLLIQPSVLIRGIYDRITEQARTVTQARITEPGAEETGHGEGGEPDTRTMDQLRADIVADMLLTGTPAIDDPDAGIDLGAIRARVQVTVPVLTLSGHGTEPAVLAGSGPIDPDTARTLTGNSPGWERVLTHPVTGAVLAVDRYRPSEDLKRLLRARDEHCRFPGCRMPTHRCDLDHTHDAARGGSTCDTNLAHLCRRHHTLKHATPWTVTQQSGGVLEWTSPTGRRYTDTPEPLLRFAPAND